MMIGIDFGTSNSSVAIYRPTGAEIIETIDGADYMPSTVADTADGLVAGDAANRVMLRHPEYTFRNIKRYLGVDYNEQEHGSFHLTEGPDGKVWWNGRNGPLSGPVLVAEVLKLLLLAAEVRLGRKPTGAVIAVPVDFREPQRNAILEAAAIAGLNPKKTHLFEEPMCAALAYNIDKPKFAHVLVYDFGGGTFDGTILKIKDGVMKALGMSGSAQIGGADFDQRLADYAVDKFFEKEGEDLRAHQKQMVGILAAAERAKKVLSRDTSADIQEPNVAFQKSGLASLDVTVQRSEFEDMTEDLVIRTMASVNAALDQAGMTAERVDGVLLVGGQSRMPMIRDVLAGMFGEKKIIKDGPRAEFAVAQGAAIRAAELDGRLKRSVMQRLVPSSIGIRVAGGGYRSFIKRGETFPIRREQVLRAAYEDQRELRLIVVQGEDPEAALNTEVCRFDVPVADASARVPVMLDVDQNGRLIVWIAGKVVYGELEDAA
jgi:molecular chaperone DnaK